MRYLVFAYDAYYPGGGWDDYRGASDTLEGAHIIVSVDKLTRWDYVEIVDLETREVVWNK